MGAIESFFRREQVGRRDGLFRSSSSSLSSNQRSCLARLLCCRTFDCLVLYCTIAVFLSFLFLFHFLLPGSVTNDSYSSGHGGGVVLPDTLSSFLKGLEFGEGLVLEPRKIVERFRSNNDYNEGGSNSGTARRRFWIRKPKLALVFGDLLPDPIQMLMVTVATALQEIGYEFEVYSLEDGPVSHIWHRIGVPITIIRFNQEMQIAVDWLNFDGVIVNSLEARNIFSSFMQEPFNSLPLIWTIHENTLAIRSRQYISRGQLELVNEWKKVFNRSTVVVFPNHVLPMIYSSFDAGNYYVIPGSPTEVWETDIMVSSYQGNMRTKMGYRPDDVVIAIVGSPFMYSGLLLEHAFVLQALFPLCQKLPFHNDSSSHLKIIVLSGDSANKYGVAIKAIAGNLSYPRAAVKHVAVDGNVSFVLGAVDVVVYGSFVEEQSFPEILIKAMCIGKPIVAPNLSVIKKHVDDRMNGYLFPKEEIGVLTQIVSELISDGRQSALASNVISLAKGTAKNIMVQETVQGYALLLDNVLKLPSEVEPPSGVTQKLPNLIHGWRWDLFEAFMNSAYQGRILRSYRFIDEVEELANHSQTASPDATAATDQLVFYDLWQDERNNEIIDSKQRILEDELNNRDEQPHRTWEDVSRKSKRADRLRNVLHERDERELERIGQPICIYEPYFGKGVWPFLHLRSLYRGIGLSTKGRRPETDDVDAPSRLPLLNNVHYRDTLGEYGAFFAIAYQTDHLHKNAWIGFQSWRATARKASLSRTGEKALLDAIETGRHGDALYFWVRMDNDPRNVLQLDFWSFCDTINAGNCKSAFFEAFERMYGIKKELDLPPMPEDGDTWSVMLSWALPTRSFQEFVMFSRMFVDALDAQMYDEHHTSGQCYLSLSKDKHCYSRVLELLVNVWAYHSARGMVYVNPETGLMQEQHKLRTRRGKMWVKWFSYTTLKGMDEDLAEEADSDPPKGRWLWPSTGEVIWQGVLDKERDLRIQRKEKKKQRTRERIGRMRRRRKQKVIGKYVKPPPDDDDDDEETSN